MNINFEVWPVVAIMAFFVTMFCVNAPRQQKPEYVTMARAIYIVILLAFAVVMFFFTTPPDPSTMIPLR